MRERLFDKNGGERPVQGLGTPRAWAETKTKTPGTMKENSVRRLKHTAYKMLTYAYY